MLLRRGATVALLASLALTACTCGDGPGASGDWKALFDTLIKGLPEARTEIPSEAVPRGLAWGASSPDPEAWRAWAAAQPFAQGLMATPGFEDVVLSRTYLAIDGLRRTVARAASLTGDPEDAYALWRGPTAVGVDDLSAASPTFVVVKRIDPSMRAVVRLAAAFVSTKDTSDTEVGAIKVRTVYGSGRTLAFAVFKNLLIIGNDTAWVARSAALAQGSPKDQDEPLSKDPLMPAHDTAGLHARVVLDGGELASLVGLDAVGVSLVADANAPLVLRRGGEATASAGALGLLAYAPASTTLAVVDGGKPEATVVDALTRLSTQLAESADDEDEEEAPKPKRKGKGKAKAPEPFDGAALGEALTPGVTILLGARDEASAAADLGVVVVLGHDDRKVVEAQATRLIAQLTGEDVQRTVLEDAGGATLLAVGDTKVCAGVTDRALVLALSTDATRRALAAGAGKAPSVRDRAKLDDKVEAAGGVYVDLPRTAQWLDAFYAQALSGDEQLTAADAKAVLGPTFEALGKGPVLFAKLQPAREHAAGALEVLP